MHVYKPKSTKHDAPIMPAGFDSLVANGGKIKNKTRYLFDELIKKPLVATSEVDLNTFDETSNEADDFFKPSNSKVPTQDEVDRCVLVFLLSSFTNRTY